MTDATTALLLIEDNPGDARLIQEYLSGIPYERFTITWVKSLQEAVLELMDDEPDIVLLDLGLPDSKGLETLQEFMQHCQKAPVVVLTGNDDAKLGRESIKHGAQDFLNKGEITQGNLVRVIHFSLERKAGESRLRELLAHDPLTELPNRKQFKFVLARRLAHMAQAKRQVGVIDLDIDEFAQVNKRYGYAAGERYIKRVALALQQELKQEHFLARLADSQFALIAELPVNASPDHISRLAQQMQEAAHKVRAGISEQQSITLTMSAGIATSSDPDMLADTLTRNAEAAKRLARQSGAGLCRFFDERMEMESKRRQVIDKAIQHAEEREEYRLNWQPILDLTHERLLGLEVLLRWEPKETGKFIAPAVFFPVLEESRQLATNVGRWVIREACQQLAQWLKQGVVDQDVRVFINLSPQQLQDSTLVETAIKSAQEFDLAPGSLVFELKEAMLIDLAGDSDALARLRKAGIKLALDDFGSGLSPLSLLLQQPLDYLKIDQNFVRSLLTNPEHGRMAGAILTLGRELGIEVIGEGVETSQLSERLLELGCSLQQGYLYARPMEQADVAAWIGGKKR